MFTKTLGIINYQSAISGELKEVHLACDQLIYTPI